ncbi:MAG: antibiotic biosynthesis monooxygenase family protein [Candidatus Acidiferrales bacterium]
MVARVTHYRIRPGKVEEFAAVLESLVSTIDKIRGFRAVLALRGPDEDSLEATTMSVWETAADLRDCDSNDFYYHVIARLMSCCESFSPMKEQEVLVSKFPAAKAAPKTKKASR